MLTVPAPAGYKESAAQWVAIAAGSCGLLFGYDIGAITGALASIKIDFALPVTSLNLVACAAIAGAIPGALFGGRFADRAGRCYSGIAASIIFAFATVLSALAPTFLWLLAGRVLGGVAIGSSCFLGPLYITEIAPAEARGCLVAINQALIPVGAIAAYSVDLLLANGSHWRWMLAAELVPAAALGLAMLGLPESPRWLVLRRRFDDARAVLSRVRSTEEQVEEEMILMESAAWGSSPAEPGHPWKTLFAPTHRPALSIGLAFAVLLQMGGLGAVLFYASAIFQLTGVFSQHGSEVAVYAIGCVYTLVAGLALKLLDRAGRRVLLLAGVAGITLSLGILGTIFRLGNTTTMLAWLAAGAVLFYAGSFALGWGSVFWLLLAEMFSIRIRGLAMGVITAVAFAASLAAAASTQRLVERLGLGGSFWLYMFISAGTLVFVYFAIPETKDWALEDIGERLSRWQRQSGVSPRR